MKIQFTLFSTTGKYKPIATTIDIPDIAEMDDPVRFEYWKKRALNRIAASRYKTGWDLIQHGFTKMKWRIYDEEERKKYARQKAIKEFEKNKKRG